MALKVGDLYALFSIRTSGAIKSLNGVQTRIDAIGDNIISVGHLWESNITRPLVSWGKDMLKTGMDFGNEMAKTTAKALIDLDPEEQKEAYKALEDEVLRVAQSSVYTATEMAGAYDKMAVAGWEWRSMIGGLEPIADLAAASGEGLVGVSDIVTDAMTAFGLTWEKALAEAEGDADAAIDVFQGYVQHFSDVLAQAATSSNTDVGMMGESFKYAAAMAGALKYDVDDVGVALGIMANRGIKASQAGTSLRRIMSNLVSPSNDDMKMVINQLGISLYDAETGMFDFMGVMEQLREKINSSDMGAQLILGIQDLWDDFWDSSAVEKYDGQWAKFYEEGKNAYNDYIKTLKDGEQPLKTLDDYVEGLMDPKVLEGYNQALETLNNNIRKLSASEGEKPQELKVLELISEIAGVRALPALVGIVTASEEEFYGLADSIDNAEGATHRMKEAMLDTTGGSLKMLLSSIDILKVDLEELVDEKLRGLIDSARELINTFINMDDESQMTILKMAGIASAIGPALVGIGLLVKLLPMLGSAFSFVASPMGLVATALGAMAISALDSEGKISKAMGDMGKALGLEELDIGELDATKLLDDFLSDMGDLSSNPAVTGFMERLGKGFKDSMGFLGNLAGDIVSYILSPEGITAIFNAGVSIAGLLWAGIKDAWKGVGNFFSNLIDSALVGWGVISEEQREAAQKTGKEAARMVNAYIAQGLQEGETGDTALVALLSGILRYTGLSDGAFEDAGFERITEQVSDAIDRALLEVNTPMSLAEYIQDALMREGFDLKIGDPDEWDDETDAFWAGLYDALLQSARTTGQNDQFKQAAVQAMADYLLANLDGEIFAEAQAQVQTEADKAMAAAAELGINTKAAVDAASDNITAAIDKGSSEIGRKGFAKALQDQQGEAETAALSVSDGVVQQFLLTMGKENGAAVALEYLGGLEEGLMDDNAVQALSAATISTAGGVVTIFETILAPGVGSSIGSAFGNAIASAISAAAWGIDAQVQGILSSVNAASLAAQEAVAGLVVPTGATLPGGRGTSTNGGSGLTAAQITGAVREGLSGAAVNMDGQKVGNLVTPTVSENIAAQSVRRG